MEDINLDNLSLKELRELRKRIESTINNYETRKRKEALAAAEKLVQDMGFSLADLTGAKPQRHMSKVSPKYANPSDPTVTWTGRGRKPRWVQEHLDAGRKLDDLLI